MINAPILRRLAALKLSTEAYAEVLSILADVQAKEDDRRGKDADRKRKIRGQSTGHSEDIPRTVHGNSADTPAPLHLESTLTSSKKDKKERPPKVPHSSPSLFSFDHFWGFYPHKVGKGAAERAFDRVRKSGRVSFAELMAGLDRYRASKPVDRPWCNPATWLNERRWEDKPADNSAPSLSLVMPEHGNQHAGRVYLRRETPQFEAWAAHTGKAVTDKHGGWWFDSEWPSERRMAAE